MSVEVYRVDLQYAYSLIVVHWFLRLDHSQFLITWRCLDMCQASPASPASPDGDESLREDGALCRTATWRKHSRNSKDISACLQSLISSLLVLIRFVSLEGWVSRIQQKTWTSMSTEALCWKLLWLVPCSLNISTGDAWVAGGPLVPFLD